MFQYSVPASGSYITSADIRGNFQHLFDTDDLLRVHTSGSANPHTVTLQQATTGGSTSTNAISVANSGSTMTSLTVVDELNVANDIYADDFRARGVIYVNDDGSDNQASVINFGANSQSFRYNGATTKKFYTSKGLDTNGPISVAGSGSIMGSILIPGDVTIGGTLSAGISAVTTDHGGLAGLGDDDHPHYLLTNGNRNITGNLKVNTSGSYFNGDIAVVGDVNIYGGDLNVMGSDVRVDGVVYVNDDGDENQASVINFGGNSQTFRYNGDSSKRFY